MTRWILDREAQGGTPSAGLRRLMADDSAGAEARSAELVVAGAAQGGARTTVSGDDAGAAPEAGGATCARIGRELIGDPATTLSVVGIVGGSGKSATAAFLRGICRAEGQVIGSVGPSTWFDGDSIRPLPHSGGRARVAAMLAGMTHQGCDSAILEIGRAAIDRRELDEVALRAVVVTSLDDEDRAARRRSCARLIRRVEPGGMVVIDADDPEADVLGAVNLGARRVTYAIEADERAHPRANVTAEIIRVDAGSCRFWLRGFDRDVVVTLRVGGGRATIRPALAAAAAAWSLGLPADIVVRGLESVSRVPGRFEPVRAGQPFEVRVDRARQAGDLTRTLAHLRAVTSGRVFCVVGAEGAPLGVAPLTLREAERAAIGRAAELGADLIVLTTDDPRDEDPNAIVDAMLAGMIHPGRARVELDRRAAIALALAEALPGDGVLIAGKGVRLDQAFADRVVAFDDAAVADQLLRTANTASNRASA